MAMLSPAAKESKLAGGAEETRVRAKGPGRLLGADLEELEDISVIEVGDGNDLGIARKGSVDGDH